MNLRAKVRKILEIRLLESIYFIKSGILVIIMVVYFGLLFEGKFDGNAMFEVRYIIKWCKDAKELLQKTVKLFVHDRI